MRQNAAVSGSGNVRQNAAVSGKGLSV